MYRCICIYMYMCVYKYVYLQTARVFACRWLSWTQAVYKTPLSWKDERGVVKASSIYNDRDAALSFAMTLDPKSSPICSRFWHCLSYVFQIIAMTVVCVLDSGIDSLICSRLWHCLSCMFKILVLAVLHVSDSGIDCHTRSRFWHWLSDMFQMMALTFLHVPGSGIDCLACSRFWPGLS